VDDGFGEVRYVVQKLMVGHLGDDSRDSLDDGRVHGVKKALPEAADSLVANHHDEK
jgi:hypothetical protein